MSDDLMNSSGYTPANEAKGSDVRAACEAAQNDWRSNQDALIHEDHNFALARCIERHVAPAIEARAQAAAIDMRERCAQHKRLLSGTGMECACGWKDTGIGTWGDHIRALSIPTDALDAMLLRARIEGHDECCPDVNCPEPECDIRIRISRQLAALTQPAPEAK